MGTPLGPKYIPYTYMDPLECPQPTSGSPPATWRGDLVTRLIMWIIDVAVWVIGIINLLTKSL